MRLTWLADAARDAGLNVTEVAGWETRGRAFTYPLRGVVCHHTAGPATGDFPSLRIVRDGRVDLPGPLSHYGLGRSGRVYVIASGRANHAGTGAWPGLMGNSDTIGIEAEHTGRLSDPWPTAQLDAYHRLVAAICDRAGLSTSKVIAHKEWAPTRKIDPIGLHMGRFRDDVQAIRDGDDMVDRKTSVDPNPVLAEDFERLKEAKVFTDFTDPGGIMFKDEFAAFLNRFFAYVVKPEIDARNKTAWAKAQTWVRDHVKTSIAAALAAGAVGGATVDEVLAELAQRLLGG